MTCIPSQKVPNTIEKTVTIHFTVTHLNLKNPQSVRHDIKNPVIKDPKAAGIMMKSSIS